MRNTISILSFLFLVACGGPAETTVLPVEYRNKANVTVGEICVDANIAAAPFILTDRDGTISISASTYRCLPLYPGGYTVEFQAADGYTQTPPMAGPIELLKGERYEVTGLYVP